MTIDLTKLKGLEGWTATGMDAVMAELLEHARRADGRGDRLDALNASAAAGCRYAAAAYRAAAAELETWIGRLRGEPRDIVKELGELLDEAYPGRGWSEKLQALKSEMFSTGGEDRQ